MKPLPSQAELKRLFYFDTHDLRWRINPTNSKIKGMVAGCLCRNRGYWQVGINNKKYFLHRIAYKYHFGDFDENLVIDHIDNNRSNNLPSNLRVVTVQQNNQLTPAKGVCKVGNKYRAKIMVDFKDIHLGYFFSEDDAVIAYQRAKDIYHGIPDEYNRNNRVQL